MLNDDYLDWNLPYNLYNISYVISVRFCTHIFFIRLRVFVTYRVIFIYLKINRHNILMNILKIFRGYIIKIW